MAGWVSVCRTEELVPDRARSFEVEGVLLAVIRYGDEISVLSDRCPHAGGSLGQGWIEDTEIVCPLHRWRFRLRDGRCMTVRGENVYRFPAEIREGIVWVWV
jgi:nitrite reductase/ring-hydroxylating ferredoxin subunit